MSFLPSLLNSLSQSVGYTQRISYRVSFTLPPTRGQAHSNAWDVTVVKVVAGKEKKVLKNGTANLFKEILL